MAHLTCGDNGSTASEVITEINLNSTNLVTNTDAIAALTARLDTIDSNKSVEYVGEVDLLNLPETYTVVADLSVPSLIAGVYYVGFSTTHTFDTATKSAFHRMTVNSGTPEIFAKENKDTTDRDTRNYTFMYSHTATGPYQMEIAMRKEDAAGTLDVQYANIWAFRVDDLPTP